MELKNKTILVTGASSGIGQAIAIVCAQKGAKVFIHYFNNKQGAEETLAKVKEYSDGQIVQADLMFPDNVTKMFKEINEPLDCLVNNAGDGRNADVFDNEVWAYEFANIFFTQVYCSQNFLKQNKKTDLKKIINISSVYGLPEMGNPEMIAYSAAKASIISFTKTLAKEYSNILINAIAPGYVETGAWQGVSEEEKKACANKTMIKRFIKPVEIAQAAVALLENDAMTGQVMIIDGGLGLQNMEKK